jgi:hypothetical protein
MVLIDISDLQNELVYEDFEPEERSMASDFFYRIKNRLVRISTIYYLIDAINTAKQRDRFFQSIETFYEEAREKTSNNNMWELYAGFFSHFNNEILLSNPQFHGMGNWMEDKTFKTLAIRGIESGQKYMLKLNELCLKHGIRLTLTVHPWHPQIMKGEPSDEYVQRWETFARENGISFVNLYPLFMAGENPKTVIEQYYIANDNHWNEFGHKRVADYLETYFREAPGEWHLSGTK